MLRLKQHQHHPTNHPNLAGEKTEEQAVQPVPHELEATRRFSQGKDGGALPTCDQSEEDKSLAVGKLWKPLFVW